MALRHFTDIIICKSFYIIIAHAHMYIYIYIYIKSPIQLRYLCRISQNKKISFYLLRETRKAFTLAGR